ncbi:PENTATRICOPEPTIDE REPEAT-CONTAINING PROTEIN [Salix purpurea]|uniref:PENTATRICOPEPTIDE REPEAT-CONTAINING PROTEIN n=1 Tax=Salix purpurea TaxID=77065 RepID=A0A9Q0ZNK5_SALPP|nr:PENTATRICOPEPTIDE REPEAT-CONTAINING PROTEIN [Salix purpurea]
MARHGLVKQIVGSAGGGDVFFTDSSPFAKLLDLCVKFRSSRDARSVHGRIIQTPFCKEVFIQNRLVDVYGKCGYLDYARKVFDRMSERNVYSYNSIISTLMRWSFVDEGAWLFSLMPEKDQCSWNSMIAGFAQHDRFEEALDCFVRMHKDDFVLNDYSFGSGLSASFKEGVQIHAHVMKSEKFRNDLILGNALVDMYAKCGRVNEARCVFDRMPVRNAVSETTMVSGYAKSASVNAARSMFATIKQKDIVSWNALIAGYTQNGENEEALGLFRMLKRESVCPTHYTFGNLLNACANLADLELGRQAHSHVVKHGFRFQFGEEPDIFVGNSLIDMYMKCGSVEEGLRVFENLVEKDNVSWNTMIVGYAQNGYGTEALELFQKMLESGEKPDHVTMIGTLCACSHAGLVEEGRHYFFSMTKEHGLLPLKDHYTCMVDLLGRAGCLDEAKDLIESMPKQPDAVVWSSLLSACKVHRNITLGKYVAEKIFEIDPTSSGPYVLLANMYSELGRWGDAVSVRKLMRRRGVVKQPGCSWIDIQSNVHVFMVKDKKHPQKKEIYSILKLLTKQMRQAGYVPDASDHEAYEEPSELESSSCSHMEMQAEVAVM